MSEPRPYTVEEMRKMFVDHLKELADYWYRIQLPDERDQIRSRLEGFLHSTLAALDGSSWMPAFDLIPHPHPGDAEYHRENGDNWWVEEVINSDVLLHEMLGPKR